MHVPLSVGLTVIDLSLLRLLSTSWWFFDRLFQYLCFSSGSLSFSLLRSASLDCMADRCSSVMLGRGFVAGLAISLLY